MILPAPYCKNVARTLSGFYFFVLENVVFYITVSDISTGNQYNSLSKIKFSPRCASHGLVIITILLISLRI